MKPTKLALVIMGFISPLLADPKPCDSLEELCAQIRKDADISQKKPLVLIDIDDTIGYCKLKYSALPYHLPFTVLNPFQETPIRRRLHPIFKIAPAEQHTVSAINELHKAGIPAFALTARHSVEAQRTYEQLQEMGIDFAQTSKLSLNNKKLELSHDHNLIINNEKVAARFYNGVICTNDINKGTVLQQFLIDNKLVPSQIIFVDNDKKNCEQVEQAMNQIKIPVTTYHYKPQKYTRPWYIAADTLFSMAAVATLYTLYKQLAS